MGVMGESTMAMVCIDRSQEGRMQRLATLRSLYSNIPVANIDYLRSRGLVGGLSWSR